MLLVALPVDESASLARGLSAGDSLVVSTTATLLLLLASLLLLLPLGERQSWLPGPRWTSSVLTTLAAVGPVDEEEDEAQEVARVAGREEEEVEVVVRPGMITERGRSTSFKATAFTPFVMALIGGFVF